MTNKKHKPDASEVKRAKEMIVKALTLKSQMAANRDELRGMIDDLNDIVESWDSGIESVESGLLEAERGVDELSQYV